VGPLEYKDEAFIIPPLVTRRRQLYLFRKLSDSKMS
jgi:hypothetical protein